MIKYSKAVHLFIDTTKGEYLTLRDVKDKIEVSKKDEKDYISYNKKHRKYLMEEV